MKLIVMLLAVAGVSLHAQTEVIDRVLAVVAGEIITQSDVDGAIVLELVPTSGAPDRRGAALQYLIERELMLREVRRYLPPEPPPAAVEQRFDTIRARSPNPEAFARTLALSGMDEARLREVVRDDLRIRAYLDERFGSSPQPTEEEVAAYYQQHLSEFSTAGRVAPLADVSVDVRQRLASSRREALVVDWLAGLRRRTEIAELYRPGS